MDLYRFFDRNSFLLLCFTVVFFPTFPVWTKSVYSGGAYYGTLLTLVVLTSICMVGLRKGVSINEKAVRFSLVYAGLFLLLTFYSIYSDYNQVIFRDWTELLKPIIGVLCFLFGYQKGYSFLFYKKSNVFLSLLFISVPIVGIAEVHFGLSSVTQVLYVKARPVLEGKAVSPFGVTYYFGAFVLLSFFYFFYKTIINNKLNIIPVLVCIYAILLSQSRTVFIALMLGFFVVAIFLVYFELSKFKGVVFFLLVFLLFSSVVFFFIMMS